MESRMTSIVTDFKSIARIVNRQEQKAEYEAKNPEPAMYGWPYGVAVPLVDYATSPSAWNDYYRALMAHRAEVRDRGLWPPIGTKI